MNKLKKPAIGVLFGVAAICGWMLVAKSEPAPKTGFVLDRHGKKYAGLTLKIETPKPEYKVGEDILVSFVFTNMSDKPINILNPSESFHTLFHSFEFTDEAGKRISFISPEIPSDKLALGSADVAPQKTLEHRILLNRWKLAGLGHPYTEIGKEARTILVAGVYSTPDGLKMQSGPWRGVVVSKPIRIKISE